MMQDSAHSTAPETVDTFASESLFKTAALLLSQCIELLESSVTTDSQLTHISTLIPGSTIGKHLRHTHDHFRLLLDSLRSSPPSPSPLLLSYDTRSRNVASESSHAAALESFRNLRRRLEDETSEGRVDSGRRVLLEAVTPETVDLESTWARELWFASLHATHHFALLRVVAVGELHLSVPPEFGVAPSTLVYRSSGDRSPPKL
ncbi:hypothetical protein RQP46_001923 [Phenoliferia psychrophenolica]